MEKDFRNVFWFHFLNHENPFYIRQIFRLSTGKITIAFPFFSLFFLSSLVRIMAIIAIIIIIMFINQYQYLSHSRKVRCKYFIIRNIRFFLINSKKRYFDATEMNFKNWIFKNNFWFNKKSAKTQILKEITNKKYKKNSKEYHKLLNSKKISKIYIWEIFWLFLKLFSQPNLLLKKVIFTDWKFCSFILRFFWIHSFY